MRVLATFARVLADDLETARAAVGAPEDVVPRLRFSHPAGLELALVGDVLLIAGPEEARAPFAATQATVVVEDLDEALAEAVRAGAAVVRDVAEQATGANATVRFPAGPQVEYVRWSAEVRAAAGL